MNKKTEYKSALTINKGINQPPSINPDVLKKSDGKGAKNIQLMNLSMASFPGTELF